MRVRRETSSILSGTNRMHDRAPLHRLALGGGWLLLLAVLVPNCSEVPPVRAQEQTFQGVHLRTVGGGTLLSLEKRRC